MIDASDEHGGRDNSASVGASVASASPASESMMRFSHSICVAVSGDSPMSSAPTEAVATAATFTVS